MLLGVPDRDVLDCSLSDSSSSHSSSERDRTLLGPLLLTFDLLTAGTVLGVVFERFLSAVAMVMEAFGASDGAGISFLQKEIR